MITLMFGGCHLLEVSTVMPPVRNRNTDIVRLPSGFLGAWDWNTTTSIIESQGSGKA